MTLVSCILQMQSQPFNSHEWPRQNSPYNIHTISTKEVIRTKKNINLGIISWPNTKFSWTNIIRIVRFTVRRVTNLIWELKGCWHFILNWNFNIIVAPGKLLCKMHESWHYHFKYLISMCLFYLNADWHTHSSNILNKIMSWHGKSDCKLFNFLFQCLNFALELIAQ